MISFDVDMRPDFGPVRNQGRRQTCLAFAASDAHSIVHQRPVVELSTEYAHYSACVRMPTFDPHRGTSGPAMLAALAVDGQPPEAGWPYLTDLPSDISNYKPPANLHGLVRHQGETLGSLDQADNEIRKYWPVILGLSLSLPFYKLAAFQVLKDDGDQAVVGRHAVLAVGLFSGGPERGYLIRNSWGSKWGESGYGFVSRAYIEPRTFFIGVYRG
jgi:C1A family cysteine protease